MPRILSNAATHDATRREFLSHCAHGLGGVALAWMLGQEEARAEGDTRKPHRAARAKQVIQLFKIGRAHV